jgi:hypothetical protein
VAGSLEYVCTTAPLASTISITTGVLGAFFR